MKRSWGSVAAVAVAAGSMGNPAAAEVALYLQDALGDPTAVEITPGGSFDVVVGLGTADGLIGLSYQLSISASGSGKFSITARTVAAENPLPDLITSNAAVLEPAAALLDPTNDRDLGGLLDDLEIEPAPGVYPLATFTVTTAADVPLGSYTLSPHMASGANIEGEDLPVTLHTYTIVVVAPGSTTGGGSDPGGGTGGGSEPGGTGTTGDPGSGTTPTTEAPDDTTTSDETPTDSDASGGGVTDPLNHGSGSETSNGEQQTRTPAGCGGGSGAAVVAALALWVGVLRRRR